MFTVISKETEHRYTVFNVSGSSFLIFANGEFTYQPMDKFFVLCKEMNHDKIDMYEGTAPLQETVSKFFKCNQNAHPRI